MECKKVEKLLAGYLDSSLKVTVQSEIRQHLAKCGKCTDELNAMTKLDNLIKLKVKEKPSEEYWGNYWLKLESRLDMIETSQLSKDRSLLNRFIPRFAFALNGILIAGLIFLNGLLHIYTQEIKWLQFSYEEMQKQVCTRYLSYSGTKVNSVGISRWYSYGVNTEANVQIPLETGSVSLPANLWRAGAISVQSPNSGLFLTGQMLDRYSTIKL